MVAYWNVKGCGHGPLDFHAYTKTLFNLQVLITEGLKMGFGGGGRFNMEEEVRRWTHIWEDESSYTKYDI
jgi:hypothetical protein